MTERLPNEDAILEALRAQWHRVQATAAHRAGALVEIRVALAQRTLKVEVSVKGARNYDDFGPGSRGAPQ